MPFRIDNIGIAVTDLNVAVEFYQKLGFEKNYEDAENKGWSMKQGDAVLFIFETANEAKQQPRDAKSIGNNMCGIDHISFNVDDVDKIYKEITEKGIVATEPENQSWGARLTAVVDPFGNNLFFLKFLEEK